MKKQAKKSKSRSKNKSKNKKWIWVVAIVIVGLINAFILYSIYVQKTNPMEAKYDSFGIVIPASYAIHGIDVSFYQENIHWPAVQAMQVNNVRLRFAFLKATQGLDKTDKQYQRNRIKTKEIGFPIGAYHYFIASKNGKEQANHFIKIAQLQKGDLPPVVDVEELYGTPPNTMRKELQECLQALEQAYHVKPIIYSSASFYKTYLGNLFDGYPLWVAHYFATERPRINRPFLFWQHSDQGRVNGIHAKVDFNIFNGDEAAFNDLLMK
jgi:lysozyme